MPGDYSGDDILRMQQDAAKRVREMQARSRFAVDRMPPLVTKESPGKSAGFDPSAQKKTETQKKSVSGERPKENKGENPTGHPSPFNGFPPGGFPFSANGLGLTDLLHADSDRILLMAVLFVLYKEKADELLMLAVLYIMM